LKELLTETFGTPNFHPKSKPFYDHVFSFCLADNRIWFRNYQVAYPINIYQIQIVYTKEEKDLNECELVEIGPRFVLNPIKIFDGLMSGAVLFENSFFVHPQTVKFHDFF
jgi:ribosome biogenesis protein BRX1